MPTFKSSPWILGAQGIRRRHAGDESPDLSTDGRAGPGRPAGELGPVLAEAPPLPPQHGVWSHDHQGRPPPGPDHQPP
jgi:hypothetical protein